MNDAPTANTRVFSRDALREIDRRCVEAYAIPSIVLMENAAIGMARHVLDLIREQKLGGALIFCGPGNNGGDGLALARHLHNAGIPVQIVIISEPRQGSDAAINLEICRRMNLPMTLISETSGGVLAAVVSELGTPVLIDALLGTGLDREVTGPILSCIEWINASGLPVVSADLPSGTEADSGRALGEAVHADVTCTFAGLKRGFGAPGARAITGRVEVCPIGAPRELLDELCD